ncbi:MAG: hypothetical protein AXA67_02410 [Methylothermaceae bacteria B42]|nr:MAG: hypothetical protein AXA67_02410 [Methylothermaceae bacteria B42]HHJ39339.1 hypothetical protein [Methylothermaceae bacterium]
MLGNHFISNLTSKTAPWLAGAGLAGGQAGLAVRCTVPSQGLCSGCGSCAVVVASLVTWAVVLKKRKGDAWYIETTRDADK